MEFDNKRKWQESMDESIDEEESILSDDASLRSEEDLVAELRELNAQLGRLIALLKQSSPRAILEQPLGQ